MILSSIRHNKIGEKVMGLLETNLLMSVILVFTMYITQADRGYFCKRQLEKIKLWNKK